LKSWRRSGLFTLPRALFEELFSFQFLDLLARTLRYGKVRERKKERDLFWSMTQFLEGEGRKRRASHKNMIFALQILHVLLAAMVLLVL
jgi:hypothetical protein